MDRYELKVTIGEIDTLVRRRRFAEAADVADTVDWRKVKNVRALCTVSDVYKINRRYEDSKRVLELAYAKNPRGRQIIFSLCELEIKQNNIVRALQHYNSFVNVAPRDPDRFVLQYKLYKAQGVNINEKIAVLEELNKEDYREKWSYELARLYKEAGERTLCIAQCDEMIAFFRDGRYVVKALELKASMADLTPAQRERYRQLTGEPEESVNPVGEEARQQDSAAQSDDGGGNDEADAPGPEGPAPAAEAGRGDEDRGQAQQRGQDGISGDSASSDSGPDVLTAQTQRFAIPERIPDGAAAETAGDTVPPSGPAPAVSAADGADEEELPSLNLDPGPEEIPWDYEEPPVTERQGRLPGKEYVNPESPDGGSRESAAGYDTAQDAKEKGREPSFDDSDFRVDPLEEAMFSEENMRKTIMKGLRDLDNYDDYLTQESDGQYAMVMEEEKREDSQITGQLNLQEIMSEWEKVKRDFYESNGMEAASRQNSSKKAEGIEAKKKKSTKSWDPKEVHNALKIRDDDEDGVNYDTSLFVTEDGGSFPAEFAVEGKGTQADPESGVRVITDRMYLHSEDSIRQLSDALGRILLEGSTGNVIITGDEGAGTLGLAREMIRRYRQKNPNFVGQIAKSEGRYVTRENMLRVIPRIPFGALIIERAANMSEEGAAALCEMLESKERSVLIILIDRKGVMDAFLSDHPKVRGMFPARVDIAALGIDTLLGYAREYAAKQQCEIDEYGMSALESRVMSMQTVEHSVTLEDIRDIVDEAIYYASRKTLSTLVDTFSRRRGGGGTKLMLRDRDFLHY